MKTIDNIATLILNYAISNNCQVFGQNLFKPSYISGLGKFLVKEDGITPLDNKWFDATNSELTSVGYGIGRAIANQNTLLIVKQQDFLYLANDQFINTMINCIGEDYLKGHFRIICLISDLPKEGTQAYSNNISLFSNLANEIRIDYCFSVDSFEESLKFSNPGLTISFLSSEYTYKSRFFEENKFISTHENLFSHGNGEYWDILVGFIPEKYLKKIIIKKSSIFYPLNVGDFKWLEELENKLKIKAPKEITIHESSSSNFMFADHIYTFLKSKNLDLQIDIKNYRKKQNGSFSLIKQRI